VWIAPTVVVGGRVSGTWALDGDRVAVDWFREAGRIPRRALAAEAARLSRLLDSDLHLDVAAS
jgi:hypothetical protein